MEDLARRSRLVRRAAILRGRLASSGWTLAAGAAGLALVGWSGGAQPVLVVAAMAGLVAVAALSPSRRGGGHGSDRAAIVAQAGANRLSALDLAAAVPDPLVIFDDNGSAVFANQAALSTFGAIPPGLLMPLKFRAPEMHGLIADVTGRERRSRTIDYLERVPIERAFRVSAMPLGGEGGLSALLFKDQSELRRIDRMRADFIANASHELRTPLASVSGFIETLRGPARNDEAARERFLQIMQTQTARMARLIDDLLSLSRLEMKPLLKSGEKVDLGALVTGVADALRPMAGESGVEIKVRPPTAPLEVPGSRDELTQVFENLIENAIKYGQSGGLASISFEEQAVGARREIAVTVRDRGPGIEPEHIPRLTERFYRVDVGSSRAQKGTGLGLAIVKHILTRHEGRLTIRSQAGEGAAFTVHLPAE